MAHASHIYRALVLGPRIASSDANWLHLIAYVVLSLQFGVADGADDEIPANPAVHRASVLQTGAKVSASMAADEAHDYVLDLDVGTYLLTLDQIGLDFNVHVISPVRQSYNSPSFRYDREKILIDSSTPARFEIRIDSDEYTGATGKYWLTVAALNDASDIEGYRLMTSAVAVMNGETNPEVGEALDLYRRAFLIWDSVGNVREQARAKLSAAYLLYWHASQWQEAADAAADAAFLYKQIGQIALHANALHWQAASLIEAAGEARTPGDTNESDISAGLYATALQLFEDAAEIQRQNDQWYDHAQTINNMGLTYHYQMRFSEARPYYEQAAEEFRRLDEWSAEMNPLANLAVIDRDRGRLVRAVTALERLLEIFPADREPAWRADTLDNLANSKMVLGDTDAALTSFFAALQIHEQIEDLTGQGLSLSGIGATYRMVGETDLARDIFERALPIREAANDGAGQMSVLRSLADIDLSVKQYESALDYLDQALRFARSPLAVSGIDVQKSQAWISVGEFVRAEQALANALELAEKHDAIRDAADAAFWTGRLSMARGELNGGMDWLARSRNLYESIDVRSGEASSLLNLARLNLSSGNIPAAIEFATEAIDKVEGLRSEVTNPDLRAVYLGTRAEYYEVLIEAIMRASGSAETAADAERFLYDALEVSERAKARSTVDLISEASVDLSSTVDPEIASQLSMLNGQLAEKQFQRNQLLEKGGSEEEIRQTLAELLRIRAELDVLEGEVRISNPLYATVRSPSVLRAPEIQAALGADEVLLQYWLGDTGGYAWVVTQRAIRSVALPERSAVDALARRIHASLSSTDRNPTAARQRQADLSELAGMILAPAKSEISRASTLIVAADGALQYLPFGILPLEPGQSLLETHQVISVPSTTVIVAQRGLLQGRDAPSQTLAIIGDPVFEEKDPRYPAGYDASSDEIISTPYFDRKFSRLPFSGREVEQISSLVDEQMRLVATGFEASVEQVAADNLRNFRYIHLATHGVIDASQPALSSLIFSMHDATGRQTNGHFRLHDIYNMDLNADLVVLSACDTALGREIRGEGLIGLTQGFLYAGAESVVASLWQVPDRATSELMTIFYTNLIALEQRPAEALRNAQVELSRDRRWRDPYYWGGFVLLGEWL